MSKAELEAQLAELETSSRAAKGGDIFAPPSKNWRPEPRYVTQEPDYNANFQVGDRFMHDPRPGSPFQLHRQALPRPRYNAPVGAVITPEIEKEYWTEWQLWSRGSMELEHAIRLWRQLAEFNDYTMRRPTKDELTATFNEGWSWLRGLWNARGYDEPTPEQLNEWAEVENSTSLSEQPDSAQVEPR